MIDFELLISSSSDLQITTKRQAARAVIIHEDKILMVKTNHGDYKFPGGGIKNGESHQEALIREVREETGYRISRIIKNIGLTKELRPDINQTGSFEMISYYYLCSVSSKDFQQSLDDYEQELELQPQWVKLDEALLNNQTLLHQQAPILWLKRETEVLQVLITKAAL